MDELHFIPDSDTPSRFGRTIAAAGVVLAFAVAGCSENIHQRCGLQAEGAPPRTGADCASAPEPTYQVETVGVIPIATTR